MPSRDDTDRATASTGAPRVVAVAAGPGHDFSEPTRPVIRLLEGLGENVTTAGIDLMALPQDTLLPLGRTAEARVTGLRNPCRRIEAFGPGLLRRV
jgi:MOSC domain-containing protein YiiM